MKSLSENQLHTSPEVIGIKRFGLLCAVLWTMMLCGIFWDHVAANREITATISHTMAQVALQTGEEDDLKQRIDVSLAMLPILNTMKDEIKGDAFFLSLIWAVGFGLIVFGTKMMSRITMQQWRERIRLMESEQRFRSLADSAPVLIWMSDQTKECVYFNKGWCDFTGRPPDELSSGGWVQDVHPEDLDECLGIYKTAFETRQMFSTEYRLRRHDGEYRWIISNGSPRKTENNHFIGYIGSCIDITERKLAEVELRDRKKYYRAIVDAFDGLIYVCSQDYRITFMNERLIERTGYDATGELCFKALHNRESVCPWCVNDRVFRGEMVRWEMQSPKDNHWYYIVNSPIFNEDGSISKQAMIQDVTDRKLLEQQFHHAQKLESLGVLAGGIAHDFNNILTIILGYCHMAKEEPVVDQMYPEYFRHIEKASKRAAILCHQMLSYAGKNPLMQTRVNLWLLVDEVVKMLQASINKNVAFQLDMGQRIPEIKGDSGQIQQIVMNLIINAAEAIGDNNGTITVVLSHLNISSDVPETDAFGAVIPAGWYVRLEVTDTGCGMNEETRKRIFEPFYTTKFTGRGLGMSAILGIIKAHRGMLQLHSTPGIGTTFKVYFPRQDALDVSENAAVAVSLPERAGGTLMLVDDEYMLRKMGNALFKSLGFTVITARHGREALDIFRERGDEIDVILLDTIMPVMGGVETYQHLRSISTEVPIVICSGYGEESVAATIENDTRAGFVHKPFEPEELRNTLLMMIG